VEWVGGWHSFEFTPLKYFYLVRFSNPSLALIVELSLRDGAYNEYLNKSITEPDLGFKFILFLNNLLDPSKKKKTGTCFYLQQKIIFPIAHPCR